MPDVLLAIVVGTELGREILVGEKLLVGRDAGADVVIADSEISASHALLTQSDGAISIEDLGSSNGTLVNSERVTGTRRLEPGDRVQLGGTVLEVRVRGHAGDELAPAARDAPTRQRTLPSAPVLVWVGGSTLGRQLPVLGPVVVGREAGAADLVLDDSDVSRRHAVFTPAAGGLTVQDLGSTNGTLVNGERIEGARTLTTGDRVQVGGTMLEVRLGADAPRAAVATAQATRPGAVPTTAAPATNSIEVEGLVKEFDGVRAVDGIDLRVEPGQIFGFLGPNGAGKSTTVHMLTTLMPPTAGVARVAGHDVARDPAAVRAAIGVALQAAALDPVLTAWEHMTLQTALQGVPKSERAARAAELIERVGLTDAADRRVGGYSGGMKRRLDLALALVHHPRVLFLDEPTTGLDPQSRTSLWEEVARLADKEGVTVFLTTQYLEEADLLADHIAIIDHGEIVARGTPAQLKAEVGRPTVEAMPADEKDWEAVAVVMQRFGELSTGAHRGVAVMLEKSVGDLAEVVRALDAEGLRVASINLHAPTLDDVFLAKTGRSLEGAGGEEQAPEGEPERAQLSVPGAPLPTRHP